MTATSSNNLVLTPADWDHLLSRLGYGTPEADLWFLGMEEGLAEDLDAALRGFLQRPQPFDSFEHMNLNVTCPPKTPTWRIMAKIARRLVRKAENWHDRQEAFKYVVDGLGTVEGDTLLLELLPLPAKGLSHWPKQYESRFPRGRRAYEDDLLDKRISIIQDLAFEHRPQVVFCYGEQYWPHYEKIFPLRDIHLYCYKVKTKPYTAKIGIWENSTVVVLTPFFVPYKVPNRELGNLAEHVEAAQRMIISNQ